MKSVEQTFIEKFGERPFKDIDEQLRWEMLLHGYTTAYKTIETNIGKDLEEFKINIKHYSSKGAHKKIINILMNGLCHKNLISEINAILNSFLLTTTKEIDTQSVTLKPMSNKEAKLRPIAYYIVNFFKRNPSGTQLDIADQMSICHRSLKNYIVTLERQKIINRIIGDNYQTTYTVNPETEWNIQ